MVAGIELLFHRSASLKADASVRRDLNPLPKPFILAHSADAVGSLIDDVRSMIRTFPVAQVVAIARRLETKACPNEDAAKEKVEESSAWVHNKIIRSFDVYGVTTGYGTASHRRTSQGVELQRELIRFLNAGIFGKSEGNALPVDAARGAILVTTSTLMQGYLGIRLEILQTIEKLLNAHITP